MRSRARTHTLTRVRRGFAGAQDVVNTALQKFARLREEVLCLTYTEMCMRALLRVQCVALLRSARPPPPLPVAVAFVTAWPRSTLIEQRAAALRVDMPLKMRSLEMYEAAGRGFPALAARYASVRAAVKEKRAHLARLSAR